LLKTKITVAQNLSSEVVGETVADKGLDAIIAAANLSDLSQYTGG
jgi:hypothetical protein